MAKVVTTDDTTIYQIKKWLGLNESPDGDAGLKLGEAAVMRNFRITSGGALKKRPGSKNVADLTQKYNVVDDPEASFAVTEYGESTKELLLYPRVFPDEEGNLVFDGEGETVTYADFAQHIGWHYGADAAACARFSGCVKTERETYEENVSAKFAGAEYLGSDTVFAWFCLYDSVLWNGNTWVGVNPQIVRNDSAVLDSGKYAIPDSNGKIVSFFKTAAEAPVESDFAASYNTEGKFAQVFLDESQGDAYNWVDTSKNPCWKTALLLTQYTEAFYVWTFDGVCTEPNPSTDTEVRAIWSGFVAGREVLCAACNGHLWELSGEKAQWVKVSCGEIDTSQGVFLFGFGEKLYILNGKEYKVWDGTVLSDVEGYVPIVTTATSPDGGGTLLERVNLLTGKKRAVYSPDGEATVFHLAETEIDEVLSVEGTALSWTADTAAGTVTFESAPPKGVNTITITWRKGNGNREKVTAMRYAELYNGAQDSRVFLYGDGTNKTVYSDLDNNGQPSAEYFPDLNEAEIGDANTPITAMIRHYDRLLCFKYDSAWSMVYDTITLTDGTVTAGFYVTPVNRDIGNCAPGQARLVENRPRTLDGRSVIEWKATSTSGNLTGDQRNAQRVSQRVDATIRTFDLTKAATFYDKITHEYYVIGEDGTALVNSVDADAWYVYTGFGAKCMINYKDEVYYGTADGHLRHFSEDYRSDEGEPIDAWWESGAMDFDRDWKRKYSAEIWVTIKPESEGRVTVTAQGNKKSEYVRQEVVASPTDASFAHVQRARLKVRKFAFYKLILSSCSASDTATVLAADFRVRYAGIVR